MNAPLRATARTIGSAIADRAIEVSAVTVLTAATVVVTWWFAAPTVLAAGWWIAVEVRLWHARRSAQASTAEAQAPAAGVASPAAELPSESVSAGQQVDGRAGA
ncbi:hypothetical protein [Pseudonocardia sp. ICBG1293]|uniref:hypothetical protein n=1 Tax=Pseudonocardia sp. ICBG1293 TaxID=2844382 RepID=UPI001CCD0E07|nr:hypothetical protein [Pseudonocardia sp. ICBG1293]